MTSFGDPGSANRQATVVLNADVSGYSQQMAQAAQQTSVMAQSVDHLQNRMSGMHKYFGTKLVHFAAGDFAALGAATADAATFQKQMSTLAATAAITKTSFSGMSRGIEDTFTSFGTSRAEVIQLTEALTNLGVSGDRNLTQLTRTFIKLGAATGESSVGLAQGLTQLSRQMGNTDATQIGNMANVLLTLSKNAGVSASSVLNLSQLIAPFAQQLGIGEAKVMAISTAFSKAGQDGGVAANAFSQIAQDIAQLSSTGSNDLAKYSNVLGVSVEKFKKMDKTEAFTEFVEKINKMGPSAAATLDQIGLSGVRTARSFTGLAQSGDLRTQIDTALGAQGNQDNLNKGASAAFNTLADSLAKLRNQFTEIGTTIGSTFLTPLTKITQVATSAAHAVSGVMRGSIGPLPVGHAIGGALGAIGGTAALGGIALNAAGLIGSFALINTLRKGAMPNLFNAGRAFNQGAPGVGRYQQARIAEAGAGTMALYRRPLFAVGAATDRMFGHGPDSLAGRMNLGVVRNMAIQAPGRLIDSYNQMNGRWLMESGRHIDDREDMRASYQRVGPRAYFSNWAKDVQGKNMGQVFGEQARSTAASVGRLGGAYVNAGAGQALQVSRPFLSRAVPTLVASAVGGVAGTMFGVPHVGTLINNARRAATGGTPKPVGVPASADAMKTAFRNVGTQASTFGAALATNTRAIGSGVAAWGTVGKASKDLAMSSLRAAGALKDLSWQALTGGAAAGVRAGGRVLGAGLSAAGTVGKAAAGMLFNPYVMMGYAGYSMIKSHYAAKDAQVADGQYLNPIQKYNDMLGTTTTNLANFSAALQSGGKAASGAVQTSMKAEQKVTDNDTTSKPSKPVNDYWTQVAKDYGKHDKNEPEKIQKLVGVLGALQISDPTQLHAAKEDMLAAGIKPGDVQKALNTYFAQGGPDGLSGINNKPQNWAAMGQLVATSETDHGTALRATKSKGGTKEADALVSGVQAQQQTDTQQIGGKYAKLRAVQGYTTGFAPVVAAMFNKGNDISHTNEYNQLEGSMSLVTGVSKGKFADYLENEAPKDKNFGAGKSTKQYQQFIATMLAKVAPSFATEITDKNGNIDLSKIPQQLTALAAKPDENTFNGVLRKQGGALGNFAASNNIIQQAITQKQDNAGYTDKSTELLAGKAMALADGFTGAGAALETMKGAVGDSTSALYKQIEAAQQLILQREQYQQPFRSRAQNFGTAVGDYKTELKAYNALPMDQRASQEKYLGQTRDKYESALADQQGYLLQMYQTAQQAGIQQVRAEQDYETSLTRSRRNFHTQMLNSEQDYNRQVERANDDHNTQLANQAATAAQNIYDPYKRMQTPFAMDASTLAQNLADQNERLAQQQAMLHQAHSRGLSTQAIQTLNLADPNNFGQLQQVMSGLTPQLIKQINAEVGKRVSGTKALTQNPFVLSFQQGEAEFHKQLQHGQQDYERATQRAKQQQNVALGDMASDYDRTVLRAGEDLQTAMKEVTGNFGQMYDKTMEQIANSVEKFSPKAAAQMRKDLTSLVKDFPGLLTGDASQLGMQPVGSKMNPTTKANTEGFNSNGQYGHYDKKSHWHSDRKPNFIAAGNGAPYVAPPKAEMGAIVKGQTAMLVGEKSRPEMIVPLDVRGRSFLAPFTTQVTRDVLQALLVSGLGVPGRGQGGGGQTVSISEDHSMRFTGDVNVSAADLSDLVRQLQNRKRLSALQSPRRH